MTFVAGEYPQCLWQKVHNLFAVDMIGLRRHMPSLIIRVDSACSHTIPRIKIRISNFNVDFDKHKMKQIHFISYRLGYLNPA